MAYALHQLAVAMWIRRVSLVASLCVAACSPVRSSNVEMCKQSCEDAARAIGDASRSDTDGGTDAHLQERTLTVVANEQGNVRSTPPGIDCPGDCMASFPIGTQVRLLATPAPGAVFGGWEGADCTTDACELAVNQDQEVAATFAVARYLVTVAVDGHGAVVSAPEGIDCPGVCSAEFEHGTNITLRAKVGDALGWVVDGWRCSSSACFATVDRAHHVNVLFCPRAEEVVCGGACIDPMTDNDFCGAALDCVGSNAGQACSGLCRDGRCAKRVFVTSESFATDRFEGLDGADLECQRLADQEGLDGTYKAWLSDDEISASARLARFSGPYIRTDDTVVAEGWDELVSGTLRVPISVTEKGTGPPSTSQCGAGTTVVFTGTDTAGRSTERTCDGWSSTSTDGATLGVVGKGPSWTSQCVGGCADTAAALYCIEQ